MRVRSGLARGWGAERECGTEESSPAQASILGRSPDGLVELMRSALLEERALRMGTGNCEVVLFGRRGGLMPLHLHCGRRPRALWLWARKRAGLTTGSRQLPLPSQRLGELGFTFAEASLNETRRVLFHLI